MISIRNASLALLANIKRAIDPVRTETINAENTLEFKAVLDEKTALTIVEGNVVECNDDYFDIVYYDKAVNGDGTSTVGCEAEHVSYRLNNEAYNLDGFSMVGNPTQILTSLLVGDLMINGTGFTIGTIEPTIYGTFTINEAASRRSLLLGYADAIGAELSFNKFEVSLLNHRGSTIPVLYTTGKNLKIIHKVYDGRVNIQPVHPYIAEAEVNQIIMTNAQARNFTIGGVLDIGTTSGALDIAHRTVTAITEYVPNVMYQIVTFNGTALDILETYYISANGNRPALISYTAEPIALPNKVLSLGDEVLLVQPELTISESLRIISLSYNPMDKQTVELEISNYVQTLENQFYEVAQQTVIKDKLYHGTRIGPEFGFESIRSDKRARSITNSDTLAWQIGDGTGAIDSWADVLFYNSDTMKLYFVGDIEMQGGSIVWKGDGITGGVDHDPLIGEISLAAWVDSTYKTQLDGKIETYYTDTDPNTWSEAVRLSHDGDMWYAVTAKLLKRYNGTTNIWELVEDQKAIDAYTNASTAQDTADGKRRVFTSTPTTPYDVGDLWSGGSTGDLKQCTTPKLITGVYASSDWVLATKYNLYTDADVINKIDATYIDEFGVWTPEVYAQNINTDVAKITTAQIENLVVGSNVTMGEDATISWAQVSDHPALLQGEQGEPGEPGPQGAPGPAGTSPILPYYITSTGISRTAVSSPIIVGGSMYATGKISDGGVVSAFYISNGVATYGADGNPAIPNTPLASFSYDEGGAGTTEEETARVWLRTISGTPLKIESGDNMSIEAVGHTIYFASPVTFLSTVSGVTATAVFG